MRDGGFWIGRANFVGSAPFGYVVGRPILSQRGPKMSVIIVPGSGTGELKGVSGTFDIQIANGQHSYDLEYTLPQ